MIASVGTSVMAEETGEDYVITFQAEEVTDFDSLLDMAYADGVVPQQLGLSANVYSLGNNNSNVRQVTVEQKLETRFYADNHEESDYVVTALAYYADSSESDSGSGENVTAIHRMYFSVGSYSYKPTKVSTRIVNNPDLASVSISQEYHAVKEPIAGYWHGYSNHNSAVTNTEYTLHVTSNECGAPVYIPINGGTSSLYSASEIYVNGSYAFTLMITKI